MTANTEGTKGEGVPIHWKGKTLYTYEDLWNAMNALKDPEEGVRFREMFTKPGNHLSVLLFAISYAGLDKERVYRNLGLDKNGEILT